MTKSVLITLSVMLKSAIFPRERAGVIAGPFCMYRMRRCTDFAATILK